MDPPERLTSLQKNSGWKRPTSRVDMLGAVKWEYCVRVNLAWRATLIAPGAKSGARGVIWKALFSRKLVVPKEKRRRFFRIVLDARISGGSWCEVRNDMHGFRPVFREHK